MANRCAIFSTVDLVNVLEKEKRDGHAGRIVSGLANNEDSVREHGNETLKKIAHELAESLRKNVSVDWSVRESVRASPRLLVKRILRKYNHPPSKQDETVQMMLEQAETLSAEWS